MSINSTSAPYRLPIHAAGRAGISLLVGIFAGMVTAALGLDKLALLAGWDCTALVFIVWVSMTVLRFDEKTTALHAAAEDPGRGVTDTLLVAASIASLVAVFYALADAGSAKGIMKGLLVGLGATTVVVSWILIQVSYALRYARLYFRHSRGGIDFNADEPGEGDPTYFDFAYVAFTVGATFQVSDTNLKTKELRKACLSQAILSYFYGAVILATAINLIAGLGH
jgi:uncharacterized membrane protein